VEFDAGIAASAVAALRHEWLDWRFKAVPAGTAGTVADLLAQRPPLSDLGTPLLTLDAGALDHNIATMATWAAAAGVALAPHGKTTMAPALWQRQLAAGAWGITLANVPQLRVGRAFGVRRLMLANALLDPAGLRWIAAELAADADFEFVSWVDSVRSVELMDAALRAAGAGRPVDVCVELGATGARTGARSAETVTAIADAVVRTPTLRLVGLAGYEGALAHDPSAAALDTVDEYLGAMAAVHATLPYETATPIVTAGGSAYFDRVVAVLGGLDARLVVRAGAYVVHDDGFYRTISPLSRGTGTQPLRSAMHGWARVVSRPEPTLALLDAGKRDLPFDDGLPVPQRIRGRGALDGRVTALNDQHTFLRLAADAGLDIGEVVRLGLSHPCTAMDKWQLVPVVDDADAPEPLVVDLIRTFF
jgi:D-serine deaminase-like pyridoxal phosphate-dependent protein